MENERETAARRWGGCREKAHCTVLHRLEAVAAALREMLSRSTRLSELLQGEGARTASSAEANHSQTAPLSEQAQHLQAVVLRLKEGRRKGKRKRTAAAKPLEKGGRVY